MKNNQALSVYNKALSRFNAGKETAADEVVLAMFDELKEKSQTMREMALKISMLEMQTGATLASDEYTVIMQGMSWYKKAQPNVVVEQGE